MKALVTGSLGFVGSHLCDYLVGKGWEVAGIDDLSTGDLKNGNIKVKNHIADIRNLDDIQEIFKIEKTDYVFHEAANCRTMVSVDNPRYNNDVNITGTLNVMLAARDSGVKKLVQASSCIIYAMNTPYAVGKMTAELYGEVFSKIYNLPVVSLRYSNVYGSIRQSEKGSWVNAIASLRKTKRETGRIWITGDGEQTRDWSHVLDVARANVMAMESDATGVFDVCTGIQTSMNEVAKYFDCPIDHIEDRPGDARKLGDQDPEPAFKAFGYKYEIPFDYSSMKAYL
jgi:UDP-glucose 4-epimerase